MNKKLIISLAMVGAIAVIAIGATTSYFSNTETSSGNTFIAGAIDLKVDSECHYNGRKCVNIGDDVYLWKGTDELCYCTWEQTDLDDELFFNFTDVKPGDSGEDTISLHVNTNPAWICAEISNVMNTENGCNPPEAKVDNPETSCGDPGEGQGELQDNLYFSVWMDPDCDNIYDEGEETYIIQNARVTDVKWPIADSTTQMGPIQDACIGVAWYVPSVVDNIIQGDSVKGDITFNAYQARNNDNFVCYPSDGCFDQADVMLVLDRSGSIDTTERAQLKAAAHAFVTALNPDGGVHMGQSSFADTGSLDLGLTGDQAAIHAAIDALGGGTYTNLYEGLDYANDELDNSNTPPERPSVQDYMVVITDGNPNRPTPDATARQMAADEADAARAAGVEIYVVGIGGDVDADYLRNEIADDADHYFGINEYSELEALLINIAYCGNPPMGTLRVDKVVNGGPYAGNPAAFSFSINGGAATPFEGDGSNDVPVLVGIYSVTEPAVVNYTTGYNNCTSVQIDKDETETCTITNTYNPQPITVNLNPNSGNDTSYYPVAGPHTLTSTELNDLVSSDNSRYQSAGYWTDESFTDDEVIDFAFADIPTGATNVSATLKFEWQRDSTGLDGFRVRIWDGTSWTNHEFLSPFPSADNDRTETISLTEINTAAKANAMIVRFQAHDGTGQLYTRHDWVQVDVTYTP